MHMESLLFNNSAGGRLKPREIIGEIINFMRADQRRDYKIIIGTDSEKIGGDRADFVTAIVIQRVGNGGRYFWRRVEQDKIHTLRDRIWQEVLISLEIAKGFISLIKTFEVPHFDFEIHVDVGEKGKTNVLIQELVTMIRANNFEAKTKPNSYAASSVADRHIASHH